MSDNNLSPGNMEQVADAECSGGQKGIGIWEPTRRKITPIIWPSDSATSSQEKTPEIVEEATEAEQLF
jgi:hypothetical protein